MRVTFSAAVERQLRAESERILADTRSALPFGCRIAPEPAYGPTEPSGVSMANAETMRARYRDGGVIRQPAPWIESAGLRPGTRYKRAGSARRPATPEPSEPLRPPKRQVVEAEAGLLTVAGWCLATFDRVLAEAVAREFDRIDSLPPAEGS